MRATSLMLLVLCGCPDRTISTVEPEQGKVETKDIPAVPNKDIDILFVIDDSLSMKEEQESLKANFPRFIGVLEAGGPRFLRDVARPGGGRETNYGALTLAQAFSQLASVGTSGCGIEQHL